MNTLLKPTRLYIKQCSHCELKYYGKSIKKDIETYRGSGTRWNNHLRKHKAKTIHLWNSDWFFDTSITEVALKFSADNNIVESDSWANMKPEDGFEGGCITEDIKAKISAKKLDPDWQDTVGKNAYLKAAISQVATKLNPVWQATKGTEANAKMSATRANPEWQATIGAERSAKMSAIMSDNEWQDTVGVIKANKISATKSDPDWKATIGAGAVNKRAATISDPEWKAKHSKTCEHCGGLFSKTNYIR